MKAKVKSKLILIFNIQNYKERKIYIVKHNQSPSTTPNHVNHII